MYDLTEQVQKYLDPQLLNLIRKFNGEAPVEPKSETTQQDAKLDEAMQLYAKGDFSQASTLLSKLKTELNPASPEFESCVWGKLAADILGHPEAPQTDSSNEMEVEDIVLESLNGVQEMVESKRSTDSKEQLNRRAWLIHWSLFVYFNNRLPKLVDCFFTSPYMSVIQAVSPYILRYVAVAVLVTHPRNVRYNRRLKDLSRVVQQELYEYNDSVLDFVKTISLDYNFADAAKKLDLAAELLKTDYFAKEYVDAFVESGRYLIADVYLRVHEHVSSENLMSVLGINSQEFIVRYIQSKQEAKLDAVFDESKDMVRVSYAKPSIYTQVSEKVKNIDQRGSQIQKASEAKA